MLEKMKAADETQQSHLGHSLRISSSTDLSMVGAVEVESKLKIAHSSCQMKILLEPILLPLP